MKLTDIISKCLEEGIEKNTNNTTVFTYKDANIEHVLTIYNKNYGKNVKGDVIYNRITDDCISYTWKGNRNNIPKY